MNAVNTHEQKHVGYIQQGYTDIADSLIDLTTAQASQKLIDVQRSVQAQHNQLDASEHGTIEQILDPNITCSCPSGQTNCGTSTNLVLYYEALKKNYPWFRCWLVY
jgi:hypothetical protein